MFIDNQQHAHKVVDAQVENLQRVLHEYVNYQRLVYENRWEHGELDADEIKQIISNFQQMIDIAYQHVLMAADGSLAQQVRYWNGRTDTATTREGDAP